jgi:hypothetical protein
MGCSDLDEAAARPGRGGGVQKEAAARQAEEAASERRRLLGLAEAKKRINSDYHVRGDELLYN